MRSISCVALLLLFTGNDAWAELQRLPDGDLLYQQSALIAHVRVAGEVGFRGRTVHFVEILDAARGPTVGQIAMVCLEERESGEANFVTKKGEKLLLIADRNDLGFFTPMCGSWGIFRVDREGRVVERDRFQQIIPPSVSDRVSDVVDCLRGECQRRSSELRIALNADDVRNWERDRPLRVEIVVANTGEETLHLENHIEYEFRDEYIDQELREQLREEASNTLSVKICVQRLRQRNLLHALEEMMRRLSDVIDVAPGETAVGEYDLSDQWQLRGGGRFLVWAELGEKRSSPVVLELPEELMEEAVKEGELAFEEPGPFRVNARPLPNRRTMPPVGPVVEGAVIEASLRYWFDAQKWGSRDSESQEIAVLRTPYLPAEFSPDVPGVQFAISDIRWRKDGESTELATERGPAIFRWRTVRVRSVDVRGANATVEILQNDRHNLGTSGGKIRLRRRGGEWHVAGPVQIWQS